MKKNIYILIFGLSVAMFLFQACEPENMGDCVLQPSFQAQVYPIILNNCATADCHGFGGLAPFMLTNFQEIESAAINTSLLFAIRHQTPNPMPRINPFLPDAILLPDSLLQIIECWIYQGRPNN